MDGRNRRRQFGGPCYCLRPLIRLWGVVTAIVVSGVGIDIMVHGYTAGVYIIPYFNAVYRLGARLCVTVMMGNIMAFTLRVASIVIFLLEIKWLFTLFIVLCTNNDYSSRCYQCWSVCRYCGGWHLTFPYVALGIALIVWPHRLWLSHVAGGLLIGLAMLRLLTVCKFRPHGKDDELLNHFDEHADKYDNLSDVLVDNSMPEPGHGLESANGSAHSAHDDEDDDAMHGEAM